MNWRFFKRRFHRQWVVDVSPCRRPHAQRRKSMGRQPVPGRLADQYLVLYRYRSLQIDHGQQHEHVGLNNRYAQVECHEEDRQS